jgi:Protein of unknown function (DUF1254)
MVLGAINNIWFQWVSDWGITGPDTGKGGKYLLLPPGYKGQIPEGYYVVKSPTYNLWIPWREHRRTRVRGINHWESRSRSRRPGSMRPLPKRRASPIQAEGNRQSPRSS